LNSEKQKIIKKGKTDFFPVLLVLVRMITEKLAPNNFKKTFSPEATKIKAIVYFK